MRVLGRAGLLVVCAWLGPACANGSQDSAPDGGDAALSCEVPVPESCPSTAPSYQNDVAPLVQSKCVPCHGPGGLESSISFTTYQPIFDRRFDVLQRVAHCLMPPADAGVAQQLDSSERELIAAWVVCGAAP